MNYKHSELTKIRYDEIKVGDTILFHGAKVIVIDVKTKPAPANEWFPNEKSVTFTIKPANDEAIKEIGSFYANGTYGGVGCCTVERF